jgi:dipeptidyl aminopeptidase/acylaminoacyl peptidase
MRSLKKCTIACTAMFLSPFAYADPGFAATPDCSGLNPPTLSTAQESRRGVEPEDIVRVRDIGPPLNELADRRLFTLSSDGSAVALPLRQADPASNSYCQGIMIVPLSGAEPRFIDQGGDLIRYEIQQLDGSTQESGIIEAITPQWSPDGRWVMFLKRMNGRTQVWKAATDGSGSAPLTDSPIDVDRFRLMPDGTSLVFTTRPALDDAKAAIEREGLTGYHYDNRYFPIAGSKPQLPEHIDSVFHVLDLKEGGVRSATDGEREALEAPSTKTPREPGFKPKSIDSPYAWVEMTDATFVHPATTIKYVDADGQILSCSDVSCTDVMAPAWTTTQGTRVLFLRREGWAKSLTGLYEWIPGQAKPRRILQTKDYFADCEPHDHDLLCLRETSTRPRHLVRIDTRRGTVETIFDPNPEWVSLRVGKVERINVKNSFGLESAADFVFPVNYQPGRRYPAVVVQYVSRGFLRGGVGDEYPIHALANKGYAVLSVNRPAHLGILAGATTLVEAEQINLKDWGNRKSILSSIETPLRQLIDRGIIDDKRIGITGMSDGTTTIQFAALHSSLFSAAIMSHCCWERSQAFLDGPDLDDLYKKVGYPNILEPAPEFWREISFAQNTDRIGFPILLQTSDREYIGGLEAYAALKQAGRFVDLFVFPNEFHVKWQSAHRLAIYQRTLDWFDFWFKGLLPIEPRRRSEATHWQQLREKCQKSQDCR